MESPVVQTLLRSLQEPVLLEDDEDDDWLVGVDDATGADGDEDADFDPPAGTTTSSLVATVPEEEEGVDVGPGADENTDAQLTSS